MAHSPQPDGEEDNPLARELEYNPPVVIVQDAGFVEADFLHAVGKDAEGIMTRSVLPPDLVQKRPVEPIMPIGSGRS